MFSVVDEHASCGVVFACSEGEVSVSKYICYEASYSSSVTKPQEVSFFSFLIVFLCVFFECLLVSLDELVYVFSSGCSKLEASSPLVFIFLVEYFFLWFSFPLTVAVLNDAIV